MSGRRELIIWGKWEQTRGVQDLLKVGCSGTGEGNTEPKGPTTLSQYREGDTSSGNFGVQSVM